MKCQDLAVDETGSKVKFFNTSDDRQGCAGLVVDTKVILKSNICFIKGQRFNVEEAYFGGVVYLPFPKRKSTRSNNKTA